jgi:hypothetical protein
MKNLTLILIVTLMASCKKDRQMIVFVSQANQLEFVLKPTYLIQPVWANFNIDVQIAHLNSNLKFEDNTKIVKIEFPSDSTYIYSTWIVEKKQMKLHGQAGPLKKPLINSEIQFKAELGQIYGQAWVHE